MSIDCGSERSDDCLTMIGRAIKQAREVRGLTLDQLSEATGISQAQLSRIENNLREPRVSDLLHIAAAVRTSPAALLSVPEAPGNHSPVAADLAYLESLMAACFQSEPFALVEIDARLLARALVKAAQRRLSERESIDPAVTARSIIDTVLPERQP